MKPSDVYHHLISVETQNPYLHSYILSLCMHNKLDVVNRQKLLSFRDELEPLCNAVDLCYLGSFYNTLCFALSQKKDGSEDGKFSISRNISPDSVASISLTENLNSPSQLGYESKSMFFPVCEDERFSHLLEVVNRT